MATVVDTLVLEFGLDPTKFTQGQKAALAGLRQLQQQSESSGKEVEAQGRKILDFFSNLKREALGYVATFLGGRGIKEFVGYITSLDNATANLSRTTGVSIKSLSAWEYAVQATGGQAGAVSGTIRNMSRLLNTFLLTGRPPDELLSIFTNLGINASEAGNKIKSVDDLLDLMAKKAEERYPDDIPRRAALLSLAGIDDDTINLMVRKKGERDRLLEKGRSLALTPEDQKNAAEFTEQMLALDKATTAVGRAFLTLVGPVITSGMEKLATAIAALPHSMELILSLFRLSVIEARKLFGIAGSFKEEFETRERSKAVNAINAIRKAFGKPPIDNTPNDTAPPKQGAPTPSTSASPASPKRGSLTPSFLSGSGESLTTITTAGGKRVTVSSIAATDFQNFLDALESAGAPIGSLSGYNYRNIAGTNTLSEHAKGRAVDMGSMAGRDQIDPALRAWITAHPEQWKQMLQQFNMKSGGDFKNPDLGHIEWAPRVTGDLGAGGAPGAAVNGARTSTQNNTNTHSVSVGQLIVQTQATDASGIVRDIKPLLENASFAASANYAQV